MYVAVHLLVTLMLTLTKFVYMYTTHTHTHMHSCSYIHTHTHTHTHIYHTELTLTVDNLTAVLDSVRGNMDGIISWLQIPYSKQSELQQQYDRGQVNRGYAEYFINNNLVPLWTMVANALWEGRETGALEMVQKLYLKGEPYVLWCKSEGKNVSLRILC